MGQLIAFVATVHNLIETNFIRDKILSPASIIPSRRRKKRKVSNVLQFGDMSLVENVTGVSELKLYDYFGKLIS